MNDYYNLVTVVNAREDCKQILAILEAIKNGKLANDLRLLNYYHEVPVSYGASVDYIEGDMVDFSVHQHQVVVMKQDKKTILRSSHFPHDVIANVFRAKLTNCLVTLTNFAYATVRAERRRFVRVTIKETLEAVFTDGERLLHGSLFDLSLCGVALLVADSTAFDTQDKGMLLFSLYDTPLSLPATLVKIKEEGAERKYIFDFTITGREENLISQFIFQRQVEIVKELKEQII